MAARSLTSAVWTYAPYDFQWIQLMPTRIIVKNSEVSGAIPSASDLRIGELAINAADGYLYTKKTDGTVTLINGSGDLAVTGGGGLANIVEDTTPQLGGNLDLNSYSIASVTPTIFSYLTTISSNVQTQLNAKALASDLTTHTSDTAAHSATSANTASRIVMRDANGDFSAGTIQANLSGVATSATTATTATSATTAGTFTGPMTSSALASAISDETGSGLLVFNDTPTLVTPRFQNNGYLADANGNEEIVLATTASAVNYVKITNAATGDNPIFESAGDDTNIGLNLSSKGTGTINFAKAYREVFTTLTDGATVTLNASLGNEFGLTATSGVGATRALNTITNTPAAGYTQSIIIHFQQSDQGGNSLTFASDVIGGADIALPLSYSSSSGMIDLVGLKWEPQKSKWSVAAFIKGIS